MELINPLTSRQYRSIIIKTTGKELCQTNSCSRNSFCFLSNKFLLLYLSMSSFVVTIFVQNNLLRRLEGKGQEFYLNLFSPWLTSPLLQKGKSISLLKKNLVNKRPHLKQDDIWPCFITKATSLNHFYANQSYFSYQLIYSN